jgi:DNA replication and repair protein RecF
VFLKSLSLLQYKNLEDIDYQLDHKINCFVGQNGVGKTNVLDAIYHLAFGKSYFNPLAVQNIMHDKDFYVIDGVFEKEERTEQIICSLKKGNKKVLKRNGKIYDKMADHVGLIPLVMISPSDQDLIAEGGETRRRFLDNVISQLDSKYLQFLINYQKVIAQRNALLKYFALNRVFDESNLEIYDLQLHDYGQYIFEKRKEFIEKFSPIFMQYHQEITAQKELVNLIYNSDLQKKNTLEILKESLQKDRVLQYTSAGIHKDDLQFTINHYPIKKFGSQGQQKSFIIALKLAQFESIKQISHQKPILLFDDIFDKLDTERVEKIIQMINNETFGQIFISDTHTERTKNLVAAVHQSYKIFEMR